MADYNLGTARGRIEVDSSGIDKGFGQAGASADKLEGKLEKSSQSMQRVGKTATIFGAALIAGFVGVVKAAANFEHRMSAIGAVTDASGDQMDALRKKALQLGADTEFSAGQAAEAIEELAKAGIPVEGILGGAADAAVYLASAGAIPLARAAEIAAAAMNTFGIEARDLPKVADILAAAANASAADVETLAQSLQQAGAVAHVVGLSFQDTVLGLSLFANAGLKGSDAGTSLKTMLMNLIPVSKKETELMKKLGIITADGSNRFFDQTGKVKNLAQIQQVLQQALEGQTDAQKLATLQTIFGSDAIRAAAILTDADAEALAKLDAQLGKVGEAERVAKARMDNLKGSLEAMKGSLETAAITAGSIFLPMLKWIADALTFLINLLDMVPGPITAIIGGAILLAGIFFTVGGAALYLRGKFIEIQAEMLKMAGTSRVASAAIGGMGKAMGLIAKAGLIVGVLLAAKAATESFAVTAESAADSVVAAGGGIKAFNAELANLKNPGAFKDIARDVKDLISLNPEVFRKETTRTKMAALELFDAVLTKSPAAAQQYINDLRAMGQDTTELDNRLNAHINTQAKVGIAQEEVTGKIKDATDKTKLQEGAQTGLNAKVEQAANLLKNYKEAIDAVLGGLLSSEQATLALENQIADLSEMIQKGTFSMNKGTEAERETRAAIHSTIGAILSKVDAQAKAGVITDDVTARDKAYRAELINLKNTFPGLASSVQPYIDRLDQIGRSTGAIPDVKAVNLSTPGSPAALSALEAIGKKMAEVPPSKDIKINADTKDAQSKLDSIIGVIKQLVGGAFGINVPAARAKGGPVTRHKPYLVGEKGPEFFVPGMSGMIIPNVQDLLEMVAKQYRNVGSIVSSANLTGSAANTTNRAAMLTPVPAATGATVMEKVEKHYHLNLGLANTDMNEQDIINLMGRLELLYG